MLQKNNREKYSGEWETPAGLFNELNAEFAFTLDPCATTENHKCELYYTRETDGLKQNWGGQNVFCNPPYDRLKDWVRKGYQEAQKQNTTVVLLIPARTDTQWFHKYILHRSEIRFLKGRLYFSGAGRAPFPSMIVIFRSPD